MRTILLLGLVFFSLTSIFAQQNWLTFTQKGKASYYPTKWDGVTTRSGETLNMQFLEGAHPTLPFGTLIEVTNLHNQRSIKLRINDRPYSNKRILDMTQQAADLLVFDSLVVIDVKIKVVQLNVNRQKAVLHQVNIPQNQTLSIPEATTKTVTLENYKAIETYTTDGKTANPKGYGLQIGSYFEVERAQKIAESVQELEVETAYIQVGWSNGKQVFRVLVGAFDSKVECYPTRDKLKQYDFTTFPRKHF